MFLEVYSGPRIKAFPMPLTDILRQEALGKKAKELTSVLDNDNDNISDNGNKREKDLPCIFFFSSI